MGTAGWNATWRFALATVAARHCGAEAVALQSGKLRKVKLAGARGDVERAQSLYQQLLDILRQIELQVSTELEEVVVWLGRECGSREATSSFRRGAVLGIALRLASDGRSRSDPITGSREVVDPDPSPEQGILARLVDRPKERPAERVAEKYEPERRDLGLDDVGSVDLFELGRDVAAACVGVGDDGGVYLKKWRK